MELANPDAPDYADRLLGQINSAAQDLASADRRPISGYTEQGGAYLRSATPADAKLLVIEVPYEDSKIFADQTFARKLRDIAQRQRIIISGIRVPSWKRK